jgi:PAS domain S-box-containing protein
MKKGFEIKKSNRLAVVRIVSIYALFAATWIYFSDNALGLLIRDPAVIVRFAILKGFLFVIVTGALLYQLISRDIARRQQVEQELRKNKEHFRDIFENAPIGIFIASLEGKLYTVNLAYAQMLGYDSCEEVVTAVNKTNATERLYVDKENRDKFVQKASNQTGWFFTENRYYRKDGTIMTANLYFRVVRNTDQTIPVPYLEGFMQDITERKQMETALQGSEHRLKLAATAGHLGVWDMDIETGNLFWDDRMCEIYGFKKDSFPGTIEAWEKCLHPEDRERAIKEGRAVSRGGESYETAFRILHPNGSVKYIKANGLVIRDTEGKPIRVIGINWDVTEEKIFEEKLHQAQKMELVGRLAGGVAHDFNNILTAIIGYGNLINIKLPATNPVHHYADQIIASSEKAADLTRSLLAFSRKQVINPAPFDVNRIVTDMQTMLERVIGEDIEFKVKTADQDLIVMSDKNQLEQVLMNLVTNARDAMPQGGTLSITTEESKIDERFIRAHQYGLVGRYAVISVTDDGVGMDKTTKEHIFEPFFTTKEVGKGTGLGLAMAYGTIKQQNGFINVYSEPGMGTSFRVYLPLTQTNMQHTQEEPATTVSRGTETLLLVEDDNAVRKVTRSMLEELGYDIIEAIDGEQAIELFRENRDRVQLVISDVIMPRLGGKDIHRELKKIKSDIKILYISGYATNILEQQGVEKGEKNFLAKPFGPDTLSRKIREVLDGHK